MVKKSITYRDFSGGLSEVANDNMPDNMLVQAKNIVPGEGAGLARAAGYDNYCGDYGPLGIVGDGTKDILALLTVEFAYTAGGATTLEKKLLAFTADTLYQWDGEQWAWEPALTSLAPIKDYFVYGKRLYWLDGNKYRVYDGTIAEEVTQVGAGATPTAEEIAVFAKVKTSSYVEQRGNRWFFAQDGRDEVIYSEVGNPAKFGTASILNVNSQNSDHITGLKEFNQGLLIFKERSVHYLSGWDFAGGSDIQLIRLNVSSGTRWNHSIQAADNAVLYVGYDGLYSLYLPYNSSVVASRNLSANRLKKCFYIASYDPSAACYSVLWQGEYRFVLCYQDFTGELSLTEYDPTWQEYRYRLEDKSFWGPFTQVHSCWSTNFGFLSDWEGMGLFLGCPGGMILRENTRRHSYVAVDGAAKGGDIPIPILAETKGFDVDQAGIRDYKIKRAYVNARQYVDESSHFTLGIKADYADMQYDLALVDVDESLVLAEGDYGTTYWGWKDVVTKEMTVNRKAKRVKFFISDESPGEPLLIYGLGLLFKPKKVKGERLGVESGAVTYGE